VGVKHVQGIKQAVRRRFPAALNAKVGAGRVGQAAAVQKPKAGTKTISDA